MTLDDRVRAGFAAAFGGAPDGVARAPGRVNLIGEHTDYNDGFVLPCALGVETRVAFRARVDRNVRVVACDIAGETDAFGLDDIAPVSDGWRNYVRGTLSALADHALTGLDLAIAGDIPRGAGLSSSASLEIAVGLAATAAAGLDVAPATLAQAGQRAEHAFAGVQCGIMDQLASAAAIEGAALLIDCRSLACEPVPFPADAGIAIVQSGVVRGLVDGHYNRRRRECAEATTALGVAALRDATPDMLAAARGRMSNDAFARARHIISENARVIAAAAALAGKDLLTFGRLMAESHASMRDDFAITVPAIDRLADIATKAVSDAAEGQGGARMTGGGFGGAVVIVAPSQALAAVVRRIGETYATPTGGPPDIRTDWPREGAGMTSQ